MQIPDQYLAQIQAVHPDADVKTMRFNRDGLVNDVVIVNNEWCFRFPKDEAGKADLRYESKLLDLVARHVSLPVPGFTWHGDGCVAYRFIAGAPLSRNTLLRLLEAVQEKVIKQLGLFLQQLHNIPAHELAALGVGATAATRTRDDWHVHFQEIKDKIYPLLWADQRQWVDELFAPVLDGALDLEFAPALIHNDLASYHILFDAETQRLSGMIDFGVAGIGDPADDFALLINALGERVVQRMAPVYPVLDMLLARARFKAGALELWWVLQGLRTNDPSWFAVHIGRARDVMPIGHGA